jgi:phenylacetic acid degradation operon negative regulatory protein
VPESSIPTRTLVLGMVDEQGRLNAAPLYEVAELCGMTDQQVRLCLRRLVAEGALRHEGGRGRAARFTTAGGADAAILPELGYLQLAYRQDAGRLPWDGTWHLVGFSVPESRRAARDELRRLLRFLGGAPAPGGVYVNSHAWEDDIAAEAGRLGITDRLSLLSCRDLRVGTVAEPRSVAALLWDLTQLGADWADFERRLAARCASSSRSDRDRLHLELLSAVEFAAVMERDPLLPPELLPPDWPGRRARAAMAGFAADADGGTAPLIQATRRLLDLATGPG